MQSSKSSNHIALINNVAFSLLILILAACNTSGENSTSSTRATANPTTASTIIPVDVANVTMGVQACPAAVNDPKHWDAIIPTQNGTNHVESVTCASLKGDTTKQALITVRSVGSGGFLDAYVYSNIEDPHPQQAFKLQNMAEGNAKISGYNTIVTSEVDGNSRINQGKPDAQLKADLCREFKWSNAAGTFVQVSFPGLYPQLTRYQAEDAQAQVNQGGLAWQKDAAQVASHFASDLLKWNGSQPTIVSGGGAADVNASVSIKNMGGRGNTITLTMSRLEGNTNGGIWEITAVSTAGLSIQTPRAGNQVHSPFFTAGTGSAFEGVIGTISVLDHLYNDIGHRQATGAQGNGSTTFSTNLTYTPTFKNGSEEGMLALLTSSQADGSISGAVMQKELLG